MNLNEFGTVIKFIDKVYKENDLQAKYASIVESINELAANNTPELEAVLKNKVDELVMTLTQLQPADWGYTKQQIYDQLDAGNYLGIGAAQRIKDVLADSITGTAATVAKVQDLSNKLHLYKERINKISEGMGDLISGAEEKPPEGKGILQLVFMEQEEINDIEQLGKAADEWGYLLKGLALVVGDPHDAPTITRISKNSPLFMEIAGYTTTLILVATLIDKILDAYMKILQITQLRKQVEDVGIVPDLVITMGDGLKKFKDNELKKIKADALQETYKLHPELKKKDMQGDVKNWYSLAVEKIYNYIARGAKIDVATEARDNVSAEGEVSVSVPGFSFKVAGKFAKIRELETLAGPDRLKLIEGTITEKETLPELKVEETPAVKDKPIISNSSKPKSRPTKADIPK